MYAALYADVASGTDVPAAAVKKVLRSLSGVVGQRLKAEGSLRLPNIAKIIVKFKKALPPRQKVVFGQPMQIDGRPAKKQLKIVASKPLMDAAE